MDRLFIILLITIAGLLGVMLFTDPVYAATLSLSKAGKGNQKLRNRGKPQK
jgi:hypothetical protein